MSQESQYLLIQGVPAVGATDELVKLCALYGPVQEYRALDDYPAEKFSEVYLIKYQRIQSARSLNFFLPRNCTCACTISILDLLYLLY